MFLQPVNVRSTATSGIAVMSNYVKNHVKPGSKMKLQENLTVPRKEEGPIKELCKLSAEVFSQQPGNYCTENSRNDSFNDLDDLGCLVHDTGDTGDDMDSWTRGLGPSRYATGRAGVSHGAKQNWSQKFATQYW